MKCPNCNRTYPKPDIIDDIAYFICEPCFETTSHKVLTREESAQLFENDSKFKLPKSFVSLEENINNWTVRIPKSNSKNTEYYFGSEQYEGLGLFNIDTFADYGSVFQSGFLIEEWGLPKDLVLLEGDGHTWLALDYRKNKETPSIVVIESDSNESLTVADSFDSFLSMLKTV